MQAENLTPIKVKVNRIGLLLVVQILVLLRPYRSQGNGAA
jgi:hypothetical protein